MLLFCSTAEHTSVTEGGPRDLVLGDGQMLKAVMKPTVAGELRVQGSYPHEERPGRTEQTSFGETHVRNYVN